MKPLRHWGMKVETSFLTVFILHLYMLYRKPKRHIYQVLRSNLSWSIFFVFATQTLCLPCWWRDEGKHCRCVALFTADWLVNAVWSAQGRSGSEIRQAQIMHTFSRVNLTEHTPMQSLFYHKSNISLACIMNHHLPCTCLDCLAPGS